MSAKIVIATLKRKVDSLIRLTKEVSQLEKLRP